MFQSMLQVAKLYTATYAVQTQTLVAVTLSRMAFRQHSVLTQLLTVQLTQSTSTMTFPMVSYRSKLRATFIKSMLAILSEALFLGKERSFYFATIESLLDTPTTTWDNMSEAGMDMLSDMHLSTVSDPPTVTTEQTAMQLDLTGLTEMTNQLLEFPQALL